MGTSFASDGFATRREGIYAPSPVAVRPSGPGVSSLFPLRPPPSLPPSQPDQRSACSGQPPSAPASSSAAPAPQTRTPAPRRRTPARERGVPEPIRIAGRSQREGRPAGPAPLCARPEHAVGIERERGQGADPLLLIRLPGVPARCPVHPFRSPLLSGLPESSPLDPIPRSVQLLYRISHTPS